MDSAFSQFPQTVIERCSHPVWRQRVLKHFKRARKWKVYPSKISEKCTLELHLIQYQKEVPNLPLTAVLVLRLLSFPHIKRKIRQRSRDRFRRWKKVRRRPFFMNSTKYLCRGWWCVIRVISFGLRHLVRWVLELIQRVLRLYHHHHHHHYPRHQHNNETLFS